MSRRTAPMPFGRSILLGLLLVLILVPAGAIADPPEAEVDPEHSILVLSVGWEASDPSLSSPLHPGDQVAYANFLRESVIPWLHEAVPTGMGLNEVVTGGEYVIPKPSYVGECQYKQTTFSDIVIATNKKAREKGLEPFDYNRVVYQWTRQDCGGSEYILGENSFWSEIGLTSFGRTAVRALAFSNGLPKARALSCKDGSGAPAPYSANCTPEETVGDPYDVMGSGQGAINAIEAHNIAWLNSPEFTAVPEGLGSQTITLKPWSGVPHGMRAIRVNDGGINYWIEYRAAVGIDAKVLDPNIPSVVPGLLIHREGNAPPPGTLFAGSALLDMTPSSNPASLRDAGLPVGWTWANPLGTMRVTLNSVGAAGASVTISSQQTKVPNTKGMTSAAAQAAIQAAGLVAGIPGEELDPGCDYVGVVRSSNPDFGAAVYPGTKVTVKIGKEDPKHECL